MAKRQTMGGRIVAAREAKGFTVWQAARRLGVSPWTLRTWEQGREDIPLGVRQTMAALYGTATRYLVPDRPTGIEQGGTAAVIRIGSAAFTLDGTDDDTLRRFLASVREERGLVPGAPMRVRETDAALLADLLGGSADNIARSLQRLLGGTDDEAAEFSQWLFGRTTVGAVLASGVGRTMHE
jgi:transcriptional regulator with XRE-family HTH domain